MPQRGKTTYMLQSQTHKQQQKITLFFIGDKAEHVCVLIMTFQHKLIQRKILLFCKEWQNILVGFACLQTKMHRLLFVIVSLMELIKRRS